MRVVARASGSGDQRIGGTGMRSMMPEGRAYARTMLTWALAAVLPLLLAGGPALPPRGPLAVVRVPDEPGTLVLPDQMPTLQAVAADLDADGAPEVVRLVAADDGTVRVEAWVQRGEAWTMVAAPAVAVPGPAGQGEAAYARRPARLIVRQVAGRDRVTLVRQPLFSGPEDERECCLLVDDVVVDGDALQLETVADPSAVADAVNVIDLDGDGTDELLASYFLAPLNDASSLTEARVFRWASDHFALPTTSRLPVGSGSSPIVLGDSDGLPGEEAAFISSSALDVLFRIHLGPRDKLITEDSGLIVDGALAVPLSPTRRGVAVLTPRFGLALLSWPRGDQPSVPIAVPIAVQPIERAQLLGVVDIGGAPQVLVHRTEPDELQILSLPDLASALPRGPIAPSQSAATLAGGPLAPYVGPLPGGGPHGAFSAIVAGRLIPAQVLDDPAAPIGALAASRPVGLVGRDRAWLATQVGVFGVPPLDPAGGRLDPPSVQSASAVAIVPLVVATIPEGNGGAYDPAIRGGVSIADDVIGVGREGMVAEVVAPPGSRVFLPGPDEPERPEVLVVGDGGALDVTIDVPAGLTAGEDGTATMTVVTPAGQTYTSSWDLRLVDGPPEVRATAETTLGSTRVVLAGRAPAYATVEVAGKVVSVDEQGRFSTSVDLPPWPTPVTVTARDPIGHEATLIVSGIGIFDYRGLPWLPIALVFLAGVAVGLILRVPKPLSVPRSAGDDAVLEEIDPADRP
jgi:hypothetical protein